MKRPTIGEAATAVQALFQGVDREGTRDMEVVKFGESDAEHRARIRRMERMLAAANVYLRFLTEEAERLNRRRRP